MQALMIARKYSRNCKFICISLLMGMFFLSVPYQLQAQGAAVPVLSATDIQRYQEDAQMMISFLEFTFNTIGSSETSVREKDIIINESWEKIFVDEKVQIEDDLDENRDVPLNKDVQAYLKDIDFFFRNVAFTFTIKDIEHRITENNQLFFLITLNRHLQGVTIAGDTVNSHRMRFVEINLDNENKELKIASIYTTKLNEKEELRRWWNELPAVWRNHLGAQAVIADTLKMKHVLWYNDSLAMLDFVVQTRFSRDTLSFSKRDTLMISLSSEGKISAGMIDRQILRIVLIDTLDVSNMQEIATLEPLINLGRIKRLDISNTPVDDLMPARNLTHLVCLNVSNTQIRNLDPIRYLTGLQELNINNTQVRDIQAIANFTSLARLNMRSTPVERLDGLAGLNNLSDLDISESAVNNLAPLSAIQSLDRLDFSGTVVSDLSPLSQLQQLYLLKLENTPVSDLSPLSSLGRLSLLFIDQTPVASLAPLNGLTGLTKIYCDKSRVTRTEAIAFMERNPQVLVIHESAELIHWWNDLPQAWKAIFSDKVSNPDAPTKEELHDVTRIRALNIAGNKAINTLDPVKNMPMLNELNVQATDIGSIEPVRYLADLRDFNFAHTRVDDLSALAQNTKLNKLVFDHTLAASIMPLMEHSSLRIIYCDHTPVETAEIIRFMVRHPSTLVVYQTDELRRWWSELPEVWTYLADGMTAKGDELSREQLHELSAKRKLDLNAITEMDRRSLEINSLEYLSKMILLEELSFRNTGVSSLEPLRSLGSLRVLISPNNPIESLAPLSELANLEVLDIQNTAVRRLEFIAPLQNLRQLNCAGTLIRNLKGVEYLLSLEQLDCFNTRVRNLRQIEELPNLRLVRCYNTNISQRRINKFRELRPNVEVVFY